MNRLYLVLVLGIVDQVVGDIEVASSSFAYITIDKVRATLNHTLVDQLFERLVLAYIPEIVEELVPEPRVDQVTCGMLRASEIEVHLTPIVVGLLAYECIVVMRVHVS